MRRIVRVIRLHNIKITKVSRFQVAYGNELVVWEGTDAIAQPSRAGRVFVNPSATFLVRCINCFSLEVVLNNAYANPS